MIEICILMQRMRASELMLRTQEGTVEAVNHIPKKRNKKVS